MLIDDLTLNVHYIISAGFVHAHCMLLFWQPTSIALEISARPQMEECGIQYADAFRCASPSSL